MEPRIKITQLLKWTSLLVLVALWIGTAAKNVDDWGTSDPNFAKARTAVEEGRFQLALQYLKRAESLDPDNADIHNLIGFSYRNIGNVDLAFIHYRKALELDSQHVGAHEYLDELYLLQDEPSLAQEHLTAIENSPACAGGCEEFEELKSAIEVYHETHTGQ